jgi:hypothetical protein
MTVTSGFFNASDPVTPDRVYDATQISNMFEGILSPGVFHNIGGEFVVTPVLGTQIVCAPGRAWFNGTWLDSDGNEVFVLSAAHPTLTRIDTVALCFDDSEPVRANTIAVLEGTPGAGAVELDEDGYIIGEPSPTAKYFPIANVQLPPAAVTIKTEDITYLVGTTTPWATGILDYDEQELQDQLDDLYSRDPYHRNIIINGSMIVDSRKGDAQPLTAAGFADDMPQRWKMEVNDGIGVTVSKPEETDGNIKRRYYKVECTTPNASPSANAKVRIKQIIENERVDNAFLGSAQAKPITASFYMKASISGTFVVELQQRGAVNRSVSAAVAYSTPNALQKVEITFEPDTDETSLWYNNDRWDGDFLFNVWLAAGSDYTTGTLNTMWNNIVNSDRAVGQTNLMSAATQSFQFTEVQLEIGDKATPFEHRPYYMELNLCRRYYEDTGSQSLVCNITDDRIMIDLTFVTPKREGAATKCIFLEIFTWDTNASPSGTSIGPGDCDISSLLSSSIHFALVYEDAGEFGGYADGSKVHFYINAVFDVEY